LMSAKKTTNIVEFLKDQMDLIAGAPQMRQEMPEMMEQMPEQMPQQGMQNEGM